MKLDPVLAKAVRLARKKNYDAAIKTLEAAADRYYGRFTFYYILGVSYLYSKIFGVALRYLNLAIEQKLRDTNTLLGLAALYLNHGDTDKAVNLYLEVQAIDGANKIARKALAIIRRHPGPENISTWIDSGRLHKLFPPFPRADISPRSIVAVIAGCLAGLALLFGVAVKTDFIPLPLVKGQREVPSEFEMAKEERETPVQTGGSYRYVLTRNQVLDEYNDARKLFTEFRDDAARVKLNRILESNASEPVKNRARILISYMEVPGFDTLKDRFSYAEVIKDPFIYRDCHVIWRGMASNLAVEQNHTSFYFLVGYDTRRTMEGIVRVDYNFAISVNPEKPVEILGSIIPVSSEKGVDIQIQGIALNQAGLLEQPQNK